MTGHPRERGQAPTGKRARVKGDGGDILIDEPGRSERRVPMKDLMLGAHGFILMIIQAPLMTILR